MIQVSDMDSYKEPYAKTDNNGDEMREKICESIHKKHTTK